MASPRPAEKTQPSTTIAPDNEAKPKAPVTFIAALIRLLVEIGKRAEKNGTPFDVNEMPGTKANFRELAEKYDNELDKASSRTFDDYLGGLLGFKQGRGQETAFYRRALP